MEVIQNECVGCPPEISCIGNSCPYKNVSRHYCDYCGREEKLYHYDNDEICEECLLKQFEVVEGTDW